MPADLNNSHLFLKVAKSKDGPTEVDGQCQHHHRHGQGRNDDDDIYIMVKSVCLSVCYEKALFSVFKGFGCFSCFQTLSVFK